MSDNDPILNRVKLRQLQVFVMIADAGGVGRAAERLALSQPAVTKTLHELEQAVGNPLTRRSGRGLALTPAGEAFLTRARRVLAELRRSTEELADLAGARRGRVAVGTLIAASALLLPRAILRLKAERPGLTVAVREDVFPRLIPALLTGDLDMVVGRLPDRIEDARLEQIVLTDDPVLVVARSGHPAHDLLCGSDPIRFRRLAEFPWILPPPQTLLRREVETAFDQLDLAIPENRIESVSFLTNRALMLESDCIGVLPAHVAATDIRLGALTALPVPLAVPGRPVGVLRCRDETLTPAAAILLRCLEGVATDLA